MALRATTCNRQRQLHLVECNNMLRPVAIILWSALGEAPASTQRTDCGSAVDDARHDAHTPAGGGAAAVRQHLDPGWIVEPGGERGG